MNATDAPCVCPGRSDWLKPAGTWTCYCKRCHRPVPFSRVKAQWDADDLTREQPLPKRRGRSAIPAPTMAAPTASGDYVSGQNRGTGAGRACIANAGSL